MQRSLKNKIDEFAASVVCNNINVAAVTETWFQHDILDSFISVDGYKIHRKDRQLGRGGGVCIYLSQSLEGKRCLDLESPDLSVCGYGYALNAYQDHYQDLQSVVSTIHRTRVLKIKVVCVIT